jgi:hypothetical protein
MFQSSDKGKMVEIWDKVEEPKTYGFTFSGKLFLFFCNSWSLHKFEPLIEIINIALQVSNKGGNLV